MRNKSVWLVVLGLSFQASGGVARAVEPIFPLVKGLEWRFNVSAVPVEDPMDRPVTGEHRMRIEDFSRSGDAIIYSIREDDGLSGTIRFSEWKVTGAEVRVSGVDFPGPLATQADDFSFTFLRLPLAVGDRLDDGAWITRVIGEEAIDLPGTPHARAWRISVIGTRNSQYTVVGDYWIVPGWGIVRSRTNAEGWLIDMDVFSVRPVRAGMESTSSRNFLR